MDQNKKPNLHDASVEARDLIKRAADLHAQRVTTRAVVLVSRFSNRADVPEGTLQLKMGPHVFKRLAEQGLQEPVSLTMLPGKWWKAHVDASADDSALESGGAYIRVVATTEMLVHHYAASFCEVVGGPFDTEVEARSF